METIRKNIPSANPKLLERSYKIPNLVSRSFEEIRLHLKPQGVTEENLYAKKQEP